MQNGVLHNVSFNTIDVESCGASQRLRSDALAVAFAMIFEQSKSQFLQHSEFLSKRVLIMDPNVAFLIVSMQRCDLGPVDSMRDASLIFVPIADFDTEVPEGGHHWTLLVLQRKLIGEEKEKEQTSQFWYPPIHIDSADHGSGTSCNHRFAEAATKVIIGGLANDATKRHQVKISPVFIGGGSGSRNHGSFKPLLIERTPQQTNGYDCGIFSAMAVGACLKLALLLSSSSSSSSSNKNDDNPMEYLQNNTLFKDSDDEKNIAGNVLTCQVSGLDYNQSDVTRFRGTVHQAMKAALLVK